MNIRFEAQPAGNGGFALLEAVLGLLFLSFVITGASVSMRNAIHGLARLEHAEARRVPGRVIRHLLELTPAAARVIARPADGSALTFECTEPATGFPLYRYEICDESTLPDELFVKRARRYTLFSEHDDVAR